MSEYVKYATSAGDQYLSNLAEMQDAFVKSLAPFTHYASQTASMFPQTPAMSMLSELPTMQEVTEANFAFAQKFLKQQKKFTEKLFAVASPDESN